MDNSTKDEPIETTPLRSLNPRATARRTVIYQYLRQSERLAVSKEIRDRRNEVRC